VDEIYETLQHRTKKHGKLDVRPFKYSKNRPQSAGGTSVGDQNRIQQLSNRKKRPRSAVPTQTAGGSPLLENKCNMDAQIDHSARNNKASSNANSRPQSAASFTAPNASFSSTFVTDAPITARARSRPQSAIERSLKRPSTTTNVSHNTALAARMVRPMSASVMSTKNRIIHNPEQTQQVSISRPVSASSNAARYRTRSGLDLRRPSSAYLSQSAAKRIVHVLPMEMRENLTLLHQSVNAPMDTAETSLHNDGMAPDDDMIQVMESVAEDCLNNFEEAKEREKWTIGRRGKFSSETHIEWSGTERERQEAFERQLREAAWEQAQAEKLEKDAMEYIDTKQKYRKQRALFKAQQQRNMIKTVVLVKEPRTIQQLEQYLKEPNKLGGTKRPQSALAHTSRSRVQDENTPPRSRNAFNVGNTRRQRPSSARPRNMSFKSDRMEWQESLELDNPRQDLQMLDKFEARQRIAEDA